MSRSLHPPRPGGARPGRPGGAGYWLAVAAGAVAFALGVAACGPSNTAAAAHAAHLRSSALSRHLAGKALGAKSIATTTTTPPATTTTTVKATTTTGAAAPTQAPPVAEGPVTSPPLPAPGPGFVPGHVTAVGDSVMVDYQALLEQDVPGITVTASVSRSWTAGETALRQLEASGQLGAVVVVGLATNGPVDRAQFASMMTLLSGAARVVFVNTRVDRTWQTSNNAVLAAGVAAHSRAVLADWHSLAAANPSWLYTTQTHLPIDGAGAAALAALVAGKV